MAWALDFKYECPDSCCVVSCPVPPVPVLRIEPSTLHTLGALSEAIHASPALPFSNLSLKSVLLLLYPTFRAL